MYPGRYAMTNVNDIVQWFSTYKVIVKSSFVIDAKQSACMLRLVKRRQEVVVSWLVCVFLNSRLKNRSSLSFLFE
jgi:hypothetical protein